MQVILLLLTFNCLLPSPVLGKCCYPHRLFNCGNDVCKDSHTEVCPDGSVPMVSETGRTPNCALEGAKCDKYACNCSSGCKLIKKQDTLKWYVLIYCFLTNLC